MPNPKPSSWHYRDLPIQRKISIIIVVGMLSAIVVTVANFISFDRDNVRRDLGEEMRVLARITSARSAVAVAFGDRNNATENLATLALRSTIQHACIYDKQQNLFAHFERRNSPFSGCPAVLGYEPNSYLPANDELLEVVEPMFRKGKRLGYVLVASDLSPIAERTRKWIITSFFVTLAALAVAFLMTRRLQRAVVQPIVDLSELMNRVRQSNDLGLRAQAVGQDETGLLVDSFNEMLQIIENHNRDLQMLYRGLVEKSAEAEANSASLEVRNEHIKDLFGSAAHDLRQPLQAMTIFADTLRNKVKDPEHLSIVLKLKQAVQNLSDLFNEILDVSRYEFDFNIAGTQPTSIKTLLSKVYLEFEVIAEQKHLKLRFHTADYKVIAHGALLERIIRNLLSNAIRYTDRGGVLLGCRRRGNYLSIEVWDTGRGIPEQSQQSIFSKFVQVHDEEREKRGGFGLGLAIVKQFVDSLGYDLSVRSVVGRGTVFRLRVPLVDGQTNKHPERNGHEREVTPARNASNEALGNMTLQSMNAQDVPRILLVDDNKAVRQAVRMTLSGWGFEVDDFSNIESMVEFYRSGGLPPQLMISDYQLGGEVTGAQAITAARQMLGDQLPVCIISGAESPAVWQEIEATGFPSLQKPVKPARLRAMVNHLIH